MAFDGVTNELDKVIGCGLCGAEFSRREAEACKKGCPISRGCGMVTCPSCGYEFPPESTIMNTLTRLFRTRKESDGSR
ncbi:MAG: hypothetical protein ACHREM_25830 [Polyangiales bacterium]